MQIYMGFLNRFFVIDGVVYCVACGKVRRSILTVDEFLNAIEHGDLKFQALATPYSFMLMKEHVKTLK